MLSGRPSECDPLTAMQVPWLPDTVLVPVARVGDTDRPDQALEFGHSVAPALLDRNPDIVLHHMHDQLQDILMAERMSYFRVKWRRLPDPYAASSRVTSSRAAL